MLQALVVVLALGLMLWPGTQRAAEPNLDSTVFALVDGVEISVQQFAQALRAQSRRRFYHGAPPEEEVAAFQREVAEDLVDRVVIQQEGQRRGLCDLPPAEAVTGPEVSKRCREALRGQVLAELEPLSEDDVRAFFAQNPDLFREPERLRASVILVKVPPSAGAAQWQGTLERVQGLRVRLSDGPDSFASLAREYSDDESAARGGDMGYIHAGMLGQSAQQALAELEPGQVSEPVVLLEGVALFRLVERREARQRSFADVRGRARELLEQQRRERRWDEFMATLRDGADVHLDEKYLQPTGPSAVPAPRRP